ncbi:MAG: Hpt domain-containing protein [Pseudobacteriovorax sp.]|nr:Hpt domain-containing protein [Pseudobacteriovorax sp.]
MLISFDYEVSSAYQKVEVIRTKLQVQNTNIVAILNNISSAIFSVDGDGKIQSDYSLYLKNVLDNQNLEGMHHIETIFHHSYLSVDEIQQLDAILMSSIGEDPLSFYANQESLPKKAQFRLGSEEKVFELDFDTICNGDLVEKILINLHDVTDIVGLTEKSRKQEDTINKISQLAFLPRSKILNFFKNADILLENTLSHIQQRKVVLLDVIFMELHTLKGLARSLKLTGLSSFVHEAEMRLAHLKTQNTSQNWDALNGAYTDIEEEKIQLESIANEYLGI